MRPSSGAPAPPLPPSRRRLYTAVALLLPWGLLALLEVGLRLGGYGDALPLFVPHEARAGWLAPNPRVALRYFRGGPFVPTPELELFRAEKPAGALRVFFQGESSAQGFPYGHGGSPSRMLEQRLQAEHPDREIEVVNTALTAINSYALLDQADEIVAQRPDAVLIYTGHNEWYGAFGAGTPGVLARWRPAVLAYLQLRHVRAAQLLADAIDAGARRAPAGREPPDGAPRTVMQLMAGEQRVPLGSARYAQGLAHFRANLAALLSRYRDAGVPVLIGTVASNERDQPPLAAADGPDPDSAAAYWALARRRDAAGDGAGAAAAYREAKERDALRFRAPEAINAIIREEAARHGATVVETQQALARLAPGGVVGGTLMLEHLHPNLRGYFTIADAFHSALRSRGLVAAAGAAVPPESLWRALPVTAVDSLVGLYRTDRLVSGWPFRPRGAERTPVVDTLRPATVVQELAQAVVLGRLPWPEATERLLAAAERAGSHGEALRAARAMAQEYAYAAAPAMDAARVLVAQQRWADALPWVQLAIAREPTANNTQLAGLLLLRLGRLQEGLPYLRRSVTLAPGSQRMQVALQAAEAIAPLEARRAASPRDTAALYDLAVAYAATQQFERARETLAALRLVSPGHAAARELEARLPEW